MAALLLPVLLPYRLLVSAWLAESAAWPTKVIGEGRARSSMSVLTALDGSVAHDEQETAIRLHWPDNRVPSGENA
jgi:hypothetical protein